MALEIVWTDRAITGFNNIINYLEEHWGEKEISKFLMEINNFLELLISYPELLQKSNKQKNVYRGPVNKLTILTYRIRPRLHIIEIINIRSSRQQPLLK
jgi:plasmid stabilization system protein ParE